MQFIDGITTYIGLDRHLSTEDNPIGSFLMLGLGEVNAIIFCKVISLAFLTWILIDTPKSKSFTKILLFAIVVFGYVMYNNMRIIHWM